MKSSSKKFKNLHTQILFKTICPNKHAAVQSFTCAGRKGTIPPIDVYC